MTHTNRIFFGGFRLTLHRGSLLVEVRPATEEETIAHPVGDQAPPWVFELKRTIWLAEVGGSIRERALEGERIRNLLLPSEPKRRKLAASA